jgi:hypothetical protein
MKGRNHDPAPPEKTFFTAETPSTQSLYLTG